METTLLPFWWFYLLLILQRLGELVLCASNRRQLLARGGKEHAPESYRGMVLLHAGFCLSLLLETFPFQVPDDLLTWSMLGGYLLVQILRYWTIFSLGRYWNTRILVVPGTRLVQTGPYRWLRHPNYMVITLEFALIPLLLRAPWTLLIFSLANLFVLRHRIRHEEQALAELTSMPQKHRNKSTNEESG